MDEILTRGVTAIYPNPEALKTILISGRKLRIYFGIDPTGPNLHFGHTIPLWKLREFQDRGHQAILLIGDFTARIGDPTDKSAARAQLSPEQVGDNYKNYLNQVGRILNLNKTEIRYNSEWLAKLNLTDLLTLTSRVTFAQLIKRDMFQKRLAENKELFLHEFLYPIMQGYDSVALEVDMEIGGSDQIFNMLIGRDLLKSLKHKEKFVLATKLLAVPGQVKMSKTEGNLVTLADTPAEMYGKIMSWPDEILPLAFELLSQLPTEEISKALAQHPRDAKMHLARVMVARYYNKSETDGAEQHFITVFQKRSGPDNQEQFEVAPGSFLNEVMLSAGVIKSKSEFRRLLNAGAIENLTADGLIINDPAFKITGDTTLRIGKKRFLRLKIKNHPA